MLTHRPITSEDLATPCSFPQTVDELFFFFPKANFPLTTLQLEESLKQSTHSTVIEYTGLLAGFANFYYAEEQGICKIGNVIVSPNLRNKGIAQYLMKVMQEKAKYHYHANCIQVSCFNHNTAGLLLYKRLGFDVFAVEQRVDKHDNKVALLHFKLAIQ